MSQGRCSVSSYRKSALRILKKRSRADRLNEMDVERDPENQEVGGG